MWRFTDTKKKQNTGSHNVLVWNWTTHVPFSSLYQCLPCLCRKKKTHESSHARTHTHAHTYMHTHSVSTRRKKVNIYTQYKAPLDSMWMTTLPCSIVITLACTHTKTHRLKGPVLYPLSGPHLSSQVPVEQPHNPKKLYVSPESSMFNPLFTASCRMLSFSFLLTCFH